MAAQLRVDLGRLLELLRQSGFQVDARQYLTAVELLIESARLGAPIDTDAERLRGHLGPIFCTSPEEQARFQDVVRTWLELRNVDVEARSDRSPVPVAPFESLARARIAAGLVLLAIVAAAVVAVVQDRREKRRIEAARIADAESKSRQQERDQKVTVPDKPPDTPEQALRVAPIASFQLELARPPPITKRVTARRRVAYAAGGAGLAALVLWLGVGWVRRRLVLQRLPRHARSEFATLDAGDSPAPLWSELALRRASTALRRPRSDDVQELEILASVQGAARGAGLAVPVYRSRRAIPEYVAIIERRSAEDHRARLCNEMLDRLQALGVAVDRYFFTGDPRTCFDGGTTTRSTLLSDALGRHHRAAVLLFTDAARCFNPISGQPEPWLEALRGAPRRALLTSEPPQEWPRHAWELAEQGFVVVGAHEKGLTTFGELEGGEWDIDHSFPAAYARPYPRLLAAQPAIATVRACPPVGVVERLVRELKGYLGPRAFTWLAACAVYPELDWPLTLHLSQAVWATTKGPAREQDLRGHLESLARLPWFQLGQMPEWLRATLLSQLDRAQERALRVALAARLEVLARGALSRRSGVAQSQIRIGAWIDPIEILRTADPASPMSDAVFLGYMGAARIPAVAVEAPSAFRRLFPRLGVIRGERRVRATHRSWRERATAWLRGLRVYHPRLAGVAVSLAAGAAGLGVGLPLNTDTIVIPSPGPPAVAGVVFTQSYDRVLVAAGREVQIWGLDGKRQTVVTLPFAVESLSYRPDGTLAVIEEQGGVYEANENDPAAALKNLRKVISGDELAELFKRSGVAGRPRFRVGSAPGRTIAAFDIAQLRTWVWRDFKTVGSIPTKSAVASDLSPEGTLLAVAAASGVTLYQTTDLKPVMIANGAALFAVRFSPGGNRFLLDSGVGRVEVWGVGRGIAPVATFAGGKASLVPGMPESSRDGDLLLVPARMADTKGGADAVYAWDVASDTRAELTRGDWNWGEERLALSGDGKTAAILTGERMALFSIERPKPVSPKPTPTPVLPVGASTEAPPVKPARCPSLSVINIDADGNIPVAADALIKSNAACIAKHPEWTRIEVVGVTRKQGTAEYNLAQSTRHAQRVRDRLVKAGVASSRLQVSNVGPLCVADSAACEARNRRVVLVPGADQVVQAPPVDKAPPVDDARAMFSKATALYSEGRYVEAAELFEKAYALDPKPPLLYNAAQAYRQIGDKQRELAALQRYLATADSKDDAQRREQVEARVRVLKGEPERGAQSPPPAPPSSPDAGRPAAPITREPPPQRLTFHLETAKARTTLLGTKQLGATAISAEQVLAASPDLEKRVASCFTPITRAMRGDIKLGVALVERQFPNEPARAPFQIVSIASPAAREQGEPLLEKCLLSTVRSGSSAKPQIEISIPFTLTPSPRPAGPTAD